ncbi:MAG: inositol monophosphatase family protein [Planctomycetaceae bacterium]
MSETDFLATAEEAARAAGAVLADWALRFTVREKARADLVTEADVAAQEAIVAIIRGRYPDHNLLGEENLSRFEHDSPYCWIIDPLDGTSNYVHHFPFYAVSIGLSRNRELRLGAIYDPNREEMFSAIRGHGARLNGKRIHPTKVATLSESLVVASLPVGSSRDDPAVMRFLQVLPNVQSVQRTGSASLNLAYVAAGRIEAFWSSSLKPWDVAAGAVIVEEAGGRLSKMDGTPFELEVPDVLASNGTDIHQQLQQFLAK